MPGGGLPDSQRKANVLDVSGLDHEELETLERLLRKTLATAEQKRL